MTPSGGSQQLWTGLTGAWSAVSYLISGIVLWGGAGMWLDAAVGMKPLWTIVGVLVGNAAGVFLIYRRSMPEIGGVDRAA